MAERFIGLMSGTSLDGVDAVLTDFADDRPRLEGHLHRSFAPELRAELLRLQAPSDDELHRAAVAAQHLARTYAALIEDLLLHVGAEPSQVRAVGVHGQTIRHRPEAGYTLQLNAPALIAELTGIDVVADFRSRDLAAGGQGAPLVPAFHAAVFAAAVPRAVVNIGGMANLTGLPPRDADAAVIGFDCGPGNVLLDAWIAEHLGEPLDRDGRWAAAGQPDQALLHDLLADPYFALPPPKSTGRELFNLDWLRRRLHGRLLDPRDVQATLVELTARSAAEAITAYFAHAEEVVVCGGGAYNPTLMNRITAACAPRPVLSSTTLGIAPEHVEAMAFAWLARAFTQRQPGNLPAVTGARGGRVLGGLYPAR
jgi:anhydro-N-acetylmuramic acid kinase